MAALPLGPSLVAVMVAAPTAAPATSPAADTVATAAALVVHVTVRPVSTFPAESLAVAASCPVPPTGMLREAGLTVTVATGTAGAAVVVPLTRFECAPYTA